MNDYFLDKNISGKIYFMHKEGCPHIPSAEKRVRLGLHPTCLSALKKAEKLQENAIGCVQCCTLCSKKERL